MPDPGSLDYLQPLFAAYRNLCEESRHLVTLRDTLLPKLMTGEIDVSELNLKQLNSHLAKSLRQPGRHVSPHKNGAARTPAGRPVPLAIAS